MEPVKLVVCDIDNTLVVKHTELSERGKRAVRALQSKGILFGLASGRSVPQLHNLEEQWGIRCDLLIGFNGGEIYDGLKGTTEMLYMMEPEWLKDAFEVMAPFENNPYLLADGYSLVRNLDEHAQASRSYMKNATPTRVVKDDSEFWAQAAPKVGFRVKEEDMPAIEARAAQMRKEGYTSFKTESTMYEFCNAKASKGALLKTFCQAHGIDLAQVWAFGDMTNDISLFEVSGHGVCMANGSPDAKAAAQVITEKGVDEDGWADFVERHLLAELD